MTRHFEFVPGDEISLASGILLRRIRATVERPFCGVKAGDLGGYIEHEHNLMGGAWVGSSVWISGDVVLYGNAAVTGNVWVRPKEKKHETL